MNSARDIVFKRCGCTKEKANRQLASRCPHLAESAHGSWYCAVQVTTVGGRKARYRRGGFATLEQAVAAWQVIIDGPADQAAAGAWTVARWLRYRLAQAEPHLRPWTAHGYRGHIDRYLVPSIGRITLADPPVPRSHKGAGLAADPAARPAPRRRHPRAGLAHRPEGHPADAGPLQHHHYRRHLDQCPARDRPAQATADMVYEGGTNRPWSQARRDHCDPHRGRLTWCLRLLPGLPAPAAQWLLDRASGVIGRARGNEPRPRVTQKCPIHAPQ